MLRTVCNLFILPVIRYATDQSYVSRYMTHICEDCGMIAIANLESNRYTCPNGATCKNSHIYMIEIPYAAKLLFQELMAMMIAPRLMTTWPGDWKLYDREK